MSRVAYGALAAVAFIAFSWLGASVSHAPVSSFDLSELGQVGVATPLAKFLTGVGRFPTYFVLSIVTLVFGIARRAWLVRAVVGVAGLLVAWQTSDVLKNYFHRPRPLHPIVAETSLGYPSGHADLSLFFYGLWAYYAWHSDLPKWARLVAVSSAAAWIAAIGWSRLALGAHYPSDVIGGYLFGAGFLALAIVVITSRAKVSPPI